jgi:hypothetical protein
MGRRTLNEAAPLFGDIDLVWDGPDIPTWVFPG